MLHGKIFTRNRRTHVCRQTSFKCRLNCKQQENTIHIITCPVIADFWSAILKLTSYYQIQQNVTKEIFILTGLTQLNPPKLSCETDRAILKHAWRVIYISFTKVETNNEHFVWQRDYNRTVYYIIRGIQRRSKSLEIAYANTMFSENKQTPKIKNEIPELVQFLEKGHYELTPFLKQKRKRGQDVGNKPH